MGYLLNNMNNQYDDPLNQLRHKQQISDKLKLTLLVLVLFVLIVISLSAGEIWLFPNKWLTEEASLFIWQIRLPRILAVMMVGASLAIAGAIMQAIFENPLAEPGLLGVSSVVRVFVLCY